MLVNVNATTDDGGRRRVGELATFLVRRPAVPAERTTVAWLWPIASDTSRSPTGGFADDELARSVSRGGRLDQALAVVEGLPRGEEGAELPIALAVDPALVEELRITAAGAYTVGSDDIPGEGTEAAADFLERLRELAAIHPVVALPYGDVDADALASVGLSDVLTRSLPGTVAGTAEGTGPAVPDPQTEVEPTTPAAEPTDDGTVTPTGSTADPTPTDTPAPGTEGTEDGDPGIEETTGAGARILTEALEITPRTDLAWAAGGSFRPDTVTTLRAGGVDTLVLGPDGVSPGPAPWDWSRVRPGPGLGDDGGRRARRARGRSGAGRGRRRGRVLGGRSAGRRAALPRRTGPDRSAGAGRVDGDGPRRAVREVTSGPAGAGQMMADTGGLPWLAPSSLADLEDDRPVDAGRLADPRTPSCSTVRAWPTSSPPSAPATPWPAPSSASPTRSCVLRRGHRTHRLGVAPQRAAGLPHGRLRAADGGRPAAGPGQPARAGRRHLQPRLPRLAAAADRAERPAVRRRRAGRPQHSSTRGIRISDIGVQTLRRGSGRRSRCPPRCGRTAGSR